MLAFSLGMAVIVAQTPEDKTAPGTAGMLGSNLAGSPEAGFLQLDRPAATGNRHSRNANSKKPARKCY
jgi:hypothetical protein